MNTDTMTDEEWAAARESLCVASAGVARVAETLERGPAARAVSLLAGGGRVMTCASGASGIAAKKFAHSLCCIEIGASFMSPAEAVHGGLGGLHAGDVMVMVSRGGKTAELLPILPVCARRGAALIGVTENLSSPLARASDVVLPLHIERESDPLDIMATASFIATVALFDALLAALMVKTGYRRASFGLVHPGGAVGEALNGSAGSAGNA